MEMTLSHGVEASLSEYLSLSDHGSEESGTKCRLEQFHYMNHLGFFVKVGSQ